MNRWVLLAGFGAIALLLSVAAVRILDSRERAIVAASEKATQLARLLESGATSIYQSGEFVLDAVAAEVRAHAAVRALPDGPLSLNFTEYAERWPVVQSVGLIGTDGLIRVSAVRNRDGQLEPALIGQDVSARQTFTSHVDRAPGTDAMAISAVQSGYITQTPIVVLTKGIWSDDRQFLGVATAAVRLDAFEALFRTVFPEIRGTIAMFRDDGTLLVAVPPTNFTLNRNFGSSHLFSRAIVDSPIGVYTAPAADDSLGRRLAYRAAARYPFVIAVGLPLTDILDEWRDTSLVNAGAAAFAAAVIGVLTMILASWMRRRQREQALLAISEQNLAEAQRISGIGYFERNLTTNAYSWSPNMYTIHGVSPDTFEPGRSDFRGIVHEDDRERLTREMQAVIVRPASGTTEGRICGPDGAVRYVRYSWRVLSDGAVTGSRLFGVAQDVTDLRRAEAAIRANEARLADVVECSSDYIWESDADGRIVVFAGTGIDLFQSPLGLHGSFFHASTSEPSDLEQLEAAVRQNRQFRNLMIPARGASGGVRWVRVSGNPKFDAAGQFLGFRGAGTDVTESRAQLQQLEQQRKGEALGRLASGLAHEVNNLLQPVLIYAASGTSSPDAGDLSRSYFERIMRAADRATAIVRNVLSFARSGPPRREDVNVLAAVNEVVELSGAIAPHGIRFEVARTDLDCLVRADRTGLAQVLLNLVTNAIEAMGASGTLSIGAEEVEVYATVDRFGGIRPGRYCRVTVSDTGPGIRAEQFGQIFDPFFTTKPTGQGTGLGLSVVAGLVKTWGGAVGAANRDTGGAVFSVYLPLAVQSLQAAQ
ncbi:MAG: ATP-binding protein [Rhodospirillaceae bacterium]|nr:ATP-binding protein [Rhodospirillaceae bacterium]